MGETHRPGDSATTVSRGGAAVYGVAVLTGAALVFQVQPIAGKLLLPAFGGGAAVWTACMFFFQSMLLAGYGYAHWLTSTFAPKNQAMLHAALLVVSALLLPLGFALEHPVGGDDHPLRRIWGALLSGLAFPFVMLASTAPLLQRWSSITRPSRSPYGLYALSNVGALFALLTYPLLVEPNLSLDEQALVWSGGYLLFLLLSLAACRLLWRRNCSVAPVPAPEVARAMSHRALTAVDATLALLLSACGVVMLLAATNQITSNVAPIPFLWIAPLVVYLLTFIVCYSGERWYDRPVWGSLFVVAACLLVILDFFGASATIAITLVGWLLVLLCACMVCHGELYRLRPAPRRLPAYYLLIAAGGALGGGFVSLVAPAVFDRYWEAVIGVYLIYAAFGVAILRDAARPPAKPKPPRQVRLDFWAVRLFAVGWTIGLLLYPGIVFLISHHLPQYDIQSSRNFYGVLKVRDVTDEGAPQRRLVDGTTIHGIQFLDSARRSEPLSYYGRQSGIGHMMQQMDRSRGGLEIGVVGLGIGTLATYGAPRDRIRFYELNPAVIDLAHEHFSFLRDSPATVEIVVGDGRVSLERELRETGGRDYDLLVIDAFTSDAIPVHLLTREAFDVYRSHLAPGGLLAIHVTNSYVELVPVVASVAAELGLSAVHLQSPAAGEATFNADWVMLTDGSWPAPAGLPEGLTMTGLPASPPARAWTDDFSDLLGTLRQHADHSGQTSATR